MEPLVAAAAPIVLALVQAFASITADRWKPALSIALGLAVVAAIAASGELPWHQVPLTGITVGLAASGLYSGGRTMREPRP